MLAESSQKSIDSALLKQTSEELYPTRLKQKSAQQGDYKLQRRKLYKSRLWPLMGYELKTRLYAEEAKNALVVALGKDDCEGCKI